MADPIHVEATFQEVIRELEESRSIHRQVRTTLSFFRLLEGRYSRYESYLIQLSSMLPVYESPLSFTGVDSEELFELLAHLENASREIPSLRNIGRFTHSKENLSTSSVLLYIFLGEADKAENVLQKLDGPIIDIPDFSKAESETGDAISRLKIFRKRLQEKINLLSEGDEASGLIRSITKLLSEIDATKRDSVLVPVVEQYGHGDKETSYRRGRLRRMSVRVTGKSERDRDNLIRRFEIYGSEQPYRLESPEALAAARVMYELQTGEPPEGYYRGEIDYELTGSYHHGRSYLAAIAALWNTSLQKYHRLRDRFEVNSGTAITGSIGADAELLPVEESGIRLKTEAAFFSWCHCLVVPKSQEKQFREELTELEERFPNRNLEIIGIENLKELFYDRRLTKQVRISGIRHYAAMAWRKKFETAGLLTIFFLAAVIFVLAYGPLDKNPAVSLFSGETLKIKNSAGNLIESIHVGAVTVERASFPDARQFVTFSDITGDGRNEIFWSEVRQDQAGDRVGLLNVKKVNSSDKIWTKELNYPLAFPYKPFVMSNNYNIMKTQIGDFDGSGEQKMLASINHILFFPGILSVKNPHTGDELSRFVNTGHIRDFTTFDLNGNGLDEVIFCGINNSFDMAYLAILPFDKIDGHSPLTDEYSLEGHFPNEIIQYILIPPTIVGESILSHRLYNNATRIEVLERQQLILVRIYDYSHYDGLELELPAGRSFLDFYFNFDLSLHTVGTSDGYDTTARILYNEGMIDKIPDFYYFENFQEKIRYWGGEEFVTFSEFSEGR